MIHYELIHNTTEWFEARAGVATSSAFDRIITNKTLKMSSQAGQYANELIAELIMGKSLNRNISIYAMEWGHAHEADARNLYCFEKNVEVDRGGFFVNDEHTYGASPDVRVIDAEGETIGLAEIKCPENPAIHVEYMLEAKMNPKYKAQTQGQLLVSGADYVDWFSYHPDMPFACVRIERDEEYICALEDCLWQFDKIKRDKLQQCVDMGIFEEIPEKKIMLPEDALNTILKG